MSDFQLKSIGKVKNDNEGNHPQNQCNNCQCDK